jgi:MoxR-like ATPase
VVPEGFKRKLEASIEAMLRKDGKLKNFVGEMRLPKEMVNYMMAQVDETKQAAIAVVAREARAFLERTNLSEELAKVLTQVSVEINTRVRFVPNDKAVKEGQKLRLEVSGPTLKATREGAAGQDDPAGDGGEDPA